MDTKVKPGFPMLAAGLVVAAALAVPVPAQLSAGGLLGGAAAGSVADSSADLILVARGEVGDRYLLLAEVGTLHPLVLEAGVFPSSGDVSFRMDLAAMGAIADDMTIHFVSESDGGSGSANPTPVGGGWLKFDVPKGGSVQVKPPGGKKLTYKCHNPSGCSIYVSSHGTVVKVDNPPKKDG